MGVLIIDQSTTSSQEIAAACAQTGIPVLGTARDGLEAVHLARQLRPWLITVDLILPRLGGLQVLQALDRHQVAAFTIVVSAVTARETIVAARSAGARAYLLKPIMQPKLVEILDAARGTSATAPARASR
jgi:two-component system chemotaxis response regulator CheY